MVAEIYIREAEQPLEEFARSVFSRLGVADVEERESSNYVEGHYFLSTALGIEVVIAFADRKGLSPFSVARVRNSATRLSKCSS